VGFGKTLMMCHMAAANVLKGYKVLYITMEMSETEIAKRIDANILDIELDDLEDIMQTPKHLYLKKHEELHEKNPGKLVINEYATGGASVGNFRYLLHELKIKKNFIPDIIYIDYLNICMSARIKLHPNIGLYQYVKSIAEEIRGLAIEQNCPIVSATQLNREGFKSSDPGMENTSESFGLPATCDLLLAIINNPDLLKLNQVQIKQFKNRYSDFQKNTKFHIGMVRSKMRLHDLEKHAVKAQDDPDAMADTPVFDKTTMGNNKKNGFEEWK
jgi:hypothetical protein